MRRMQAIVGQEAPFDHGRRQLRLLADLDITTKAVERTAEATGGSIDANEQAEIQRAVQLDLPIASHRPQGRSYFTLTFEDGDRREDVFAEGGRWPSGVFAGFGRETHSRQASQGGRVSEDGRAWKEREAPGTGIGDQAVP